MPTSTQNEGLPGPTWTTRLRTDFRLAIVSLFALCTALIISPFAVYRFLIGDWLIAIIETVMVALYVSTMIYAWRSGNPEYAGRFMAVFTAVAATVLIVWLGIDPSWAFAVLIVCFLLADRRLAVPIALVTIPAIALNASIFDSALDRLTFIAVAVLISLFALVFASRVDSQYKKLSELAAEDALTGAGNRRAMQADLAATVVAHRSFPETCGLAVMDLDYFKEVNDTYGHKAGDQVLINLARIVWENTRRGDRFYRFGGEEFVLVLGAHRTGLEAALTKLQQRIREELIGPAGPITVSIGAAILQAGEDWQDWLQRADAALYRAKRAGRDQIEFDDPQRNPKNEPPVDRRAKGTGR